MKYISHRGNLLGKNTDLENTTRYIWEALDKGFDVEIDVWVMDKVIFLGHDGPKSEVTPSFLNNQNIWCHAKNIEALNFLLDKELHCFWHEQDAFTITSHGYVWAYPSKDYSNNVIAVLPEKNGLHSDRLKHCAGICSDYVQMYKECID